MDSYKSKKSENLNQKNKKSSKKVKSKVKVSSGKVEKEKVKRKCYTPEAINSAIKAVNEGLSLKKAAEMYGVPHVTLSRRLKNPDCKSSGPPTVLSSQEENDIVMWLLYRGETGLPVTKSELLDSVEKYIIKENKSTSFKNNRPGKKWYYGFRKRHPNISLRVAQSLTLARAEVTEDDLRSWFKEVKQYLQKKNLTDIHASRVFNCDETNIQLHPKPDKVLVEKGARTVYKVTDAPERENATVLFMYNAQGTRAPPMVLYKYASELPKKMLQNVPEGWGIGISDSGWMTTETFYEYITRVFYPWLVKSEVEFPVVVYMNGHASHVTMPLVKFCVERQIELITLFPHSTHITQPLDISFFHPLKDVYNKKAVPKWKTENNNRRLRKEDFPRALEIALELFTEERKVIGNGFKAAGLYSFNPDNVDYNVLKKTKKSTKRSVESEKLKENESPENCSTEEDHLNHLEKNLSPTLLLFFKSCEESGD